MSISTALVTNKGEGFAIRQSGNWKMPEQVRQGGEPTFPALCWDPSGLSAKGEQEFFVKLTTQIKTIRHS